MVRRQPRTGLARHDSQAGQHQQQHEEAGSSTTESNKATINRPARAATSACADRLPAQAAVPLRNRDMTNSYKARALLGTLPDARSQRGTCRVMIWYANNALRYVQVLSIDPSQDNQAGATALSSEIRQRCSEPKTHIDLFNRP